MVSRLILSFVLFVALQAMPAAAQQNGPPTPQQRATQWVTSLNALADSLQQPTLTKQGLDILRERVLEVRKEAELAETEAKSELEKLQPLLAALGPAPGPDDLSEPEDIAAERQRLQEETGRAESVLKSVELVLARTEKLQGEITEARRGWETRFLLLQGPSLLSADSWRDGVPLLLDVLQRLVRAPVEWWQSPPVAERVGGGYYVLLLGAVLLAVLFGRLLGLWLLRRYGRDRSIPDPSYARRLVAAVVEGVARGLIPTLIVVVVYIILDQTGLLFGLFGEMIFGAAVAISLFAIIRGLSRAALSPYSPGWRCAGFGDRSALRIHRRLMVLAAIALVDAFLVIPAQEELKPAADAAIIYLFVINTIVAAVFLSMVPRSLWRSAEQEAAEGASPAEPGAEGQPPVWRGSRFWTLVRVAMALLAATIPVAALLGYHRLSDTLSTRLILTAMIVAAFFLLRGLARDLVAIALDPSLHGARRTAADGSQPEGAATLGFWVSLCVDLVLFLLLVVGLMPIWGASWQDMVDWASSGLSGFTIGNITIAPTDILIALIIFVILVTVVRFLQRMLGETVLPRTRMDIGAQHALKTGIGYVGITIAAAIAISTAGIDLSNIALIAGALSVGIGFGLQNIVNNFVSGLILLVERPVKPGDWVIVGGFEGYIKSISVRATEIETFQRASVIVPNSEFISSAVTNWLHKDTTGRVEVAVGVAYGSDTEKVREILLACAAENDDVKSWPEPFVVFMAFGESSLDFELRCFIGRADYRLSVSSDLRFAIDKAFREAGIEIPFPQRDINLRDIDRLETMARRPDPSRAPAPPPKPDSRPASKPADSAAPEHKPFSGEAGDGDGE